MAKILVVIFRMTRSADIGANAIRVKAVSQRADKFGMM
jgi:hypothetical protein